MSVAANFSKGVPFAGVPLIASADDCMSTSAIVVVGGKKLFGLVHVWTILGQPTPTVRITLVSRCLTHIPCSAVLRVHRKIPWRLSKSRKANQRKRLKLVDNVIETVEASGVQCNAL